MSHLQAQRSGTRRANSGAPESDTDAGRLSDSTLINEESSAEEPGLLIPLKRQASIPEYDEDDKCWICLETRRDEEASPSAHGIWKKPCKCALTAHEGCLLNWISDMEKTPSRMSKTIQCPQCKSNIVLKQERSAIVDLGRMAEKLVRQTNSIAIFAGLGSAFFVTCTVYGVNAIYLICGTKEANSIILGPNGRDFEWTWRLATGLPMLPMVLIVSRTRLMDATLPILPLIFFCRDEPLHLSLPPSPAVTLALLPYARAIYESVYNRYLLPYDKKWSAEIGPTTSTQGAEEDNVGLEIQVRDIDGGEAANGDMDEGAGEEGAVAGDQAEAWRVERELVLGPETANLVVGALLFPGVVAAAGGVLGKIPFLRRILPERFHRNILGGCLFVLIKDIFTLYYKYKRAKQRRSREILNYQKRIVRQDVNATTAHRR
ncbi:hypothetical protein TWF106_001824 [Orbilia oligospora]|uniref:Uncharacterized protein n=1 Tax=Orbilia oligospora TaxID=2813651 RepID=A0A7C8K523_ORBOL|nr:hypothetical protein TWF788_005295 [Orbilia oligospora]KAF3200449.1 hypothetical protein TWF679_000752 [Orbilia oligospora]KAF3203965.1 hypothetical protein TWF106_001824 [Orbilia oligospora]